MIEFVKDHGGWFGAFAFILTLYGLFYTWRRHAISDLKEQLDDPHHRARLTDRRKSDRDAGYFAALEDLTDWADRFYGPRKLGLKAFQRCVQLAIAYPLLAALLAWSIANVHSPGGFLLFPEIASPVPRLSQGALLAGLTIVFILHVTKIFESTGWLTDHFCKWVFWFWPSLSNVKGCIFEYAYAVIFIILLALPLAVGFALQDSFYAFAEVEYPFIGKFDVSYPVVIGYLLPLYSYLGAGSLLLLLILAMFQNLNPIIHFVWVLVPLSNAVGDFLSIAATRRFLGVVRENQPKLKIILGLMLLDFMVGALCLSVFMALLTQGLDLWAYIHPETLPLDWRAYWAAAKADFWQGTALWLMALTTLAPTIIHAVMGLSAVISHKSRLNRVALQELDEAMARGGPTAADKTTVAKGMVAADIYGYAFGLVFVVIPLCLIGWSLWRVFLS